MHAATGASLPILTVPLSADASRSSALAAGSRLPSTDEDLPRDSQGLSLLSTLPPGSVELPLASLGAAARAGDQQAGSTGDLLDATAAEGAPRSSKSSRDPDHRGSPQLAAPPAKQPEVGGAVESAADSKQAAALDALLDANRGMWAHGSMGHYTGHAANLPQCASSPTTAHAALWACADDEGPCGNTGGAFSLRQAAKSGHPLDAQSTHEMRFTVPNNAPSQSGQSGVPSPRSSLRHSTSLSAAYNGSLPASIWRRDGSPPVCAHADSVYAAGTAPKEAACVQDRRQQQRVAEADARDTPSDRVWQQSCDELAVECSAAFACGSAAAEWYTAGDCNPPQYSASLPPAPAAASGDLGIPHYTPTSVFIPTQSVHTRHAAFVPPFSSTGVPHKPRRQTARAVRSLSLADNRTSFDDAARLRAHLRQSAYAGTTAANALAASASSWVHASAQQQQFCEGGAEGAHSAPSATGWSHQQQPARGGCDAASDEHSNRQRTKDANPWVDREGSGISSSKEGPSQGGANPWEIGASHAESQALRTFHSLPAARVHSGSVLFADSNPRAPAASEVAAASEGQGYRGVKNSSTGSIGTATGAATPFATHLAATLADKMRQTPSGRPEGRGPQVARVVVASGFPAAPVVRRDVSARRMRSARTGTAVHTVHAVSRSAGAQSYSATLRSASVPDAIAESCGHTASACADFWPSSGSPSSGSGSDSESSALAGQVSPAIYHAPCHAHAVAEGAAGYAPTGQWRSGAAIPGAAEGDVPALQFASCFESGNLRRAVRVRAAEYDLFLASDINEACDHGTRCQWFFFALAGARPLARLRLNLVNFCKKDSLFARGLRVLVCCPSNPRPLAELCGDEDGDRDADWHRLGDDVCYAPSIYRSPLRKGGHHSACVFQLQGGCPL